MMVLAASLHSFTALTVVTLVIGLTSVGGQVLIPLAADLAEGSQRGRVDRTGHVGPVDRDPALAARSLGLIAQSGRLAHRLLHAPRARSLVMTVLLRTNILPRGGAARRVAVSPAHRRGLLALPH